MQGKNFSAKGKAEQKLHSELHSLTSVLQAPDFQEFRISAGEGNRTLVTGIVVFSGG
jgi:hypothetical protein